MFFLFYALKEWLTTSATRTMHRKLQKKRSFSISKNPHGLHIFDFRNCVADCVYGSFLCCIQNNPRKQCTLELRQKWILISRYFLSNCIKHNKDNKLTVYADFFPLTVNFFWGLIPLSYNFDISWSNLSFMYLCPCKGYSYFFKIVITVGFTSFDVFLEVFTLKHQ